MNTHNIMVYFVHVHANKDLQIIQGVLWFMCLFFVFLKHSVEQESFQRWKLVGMAKVCAHKRMQENGRINLNSVQCALSLCERSFQFPQLRLFYMRHVICHLQHTNTGDQNLVLFFPFAYINLKMYLFPSLGSHEVANLKQERPPE